MKQYIVNNDQGLTLPFRDFHNMDTGTMDDTNYIFEVIHDGILVADEFGKVLKVNRSYERITGIKRKDIEGRFLHDIIKEGLVSHSATFLSLKQKKIISSIHKYQTGKMVLVTVVPILKTDGEIYRVVATCRELDELWKFKKEIEEKSRELNLSDIEIVASSHAMKKILKDCRKLAQVDSSVLILGESGVGKQLIAQLIHKTSNRNNGPFITINCGAIPETLLESELFGYEEGAFTGAKTKGKPGLFEMADHGSIFLDEIGDLPLKLQVKLLTVLQDKEFTRLGGTRSKKVDVRLLAATNQDLDEHMKKGEFRRDLYYRLNVTSINVPPLRERKDELPLLVNYFLNRLNKKYNLEKVIAPEVIDYLQTYSWPGNIRELQNIIERFVVMSDNNLITLDDLPNIIDMCLFNKPFRKNSDFDVTTIIGIDGDECYKEDYDRRRVVKELYERFQSTRKVARLLGVHQSTIVRWLKVNP